MNRLFHIRHAMGELAVDPQLHDVLEAMLDTLDDSDTRLEALERAVRAADCVECRETL